MLLLAAFVSLFAYSERVEATIVRVRVQKAKSELSITGLNLFFQTDSQSVRLPLGVRPVAMGGSLSGVGGMSSVVLKPQVRAGIALWTLADKVSGRILKTLSGPRVRLKGEMVRVGLESAPSMIEFSVDPKTKSSKADVIAELDLEDYLQGVLPHEMSPEWPLEALKAQAVASRTYALHRIVMRDRAGKSFHVESTVMDQVYNWLEPSSVTEKKMKGIKQALRETRGQILGDSNGRVIAAYFHADCGGHTEEPSKVWGSREESLGTAVDDSCPFSPSAKWSWRVTARELTAELGPNLKLSPNALISDLKVNGLTDSGRIASLTVITATGQKKQVSGNDLRSSLGFDKLRSTRFELTRSESGDFVFKGVGFGHGVGLCQWGARTLSLKGVNYLKILEHYYPKAQILVSN